MELQKEWSTPNHKQFYSYSITGKYETEKYICTKKKSLQKLMDKWTL